MDKQVGEILQQLSDDGLADNTIVFFYSDHGSGMPRHRKPETHLVAKLGKAAVWVLSIYFIVKMLDIIISDKTALIFSNSRDSYLFNIEILISVIIPIIIFSIPKLRQIADSN